MSEDVLIGSAFFILALLFPLAAKISHLMGPDDE